MLSSKIEIFLSMSTEPKKCFERCYEKFKKSPRFGQNLSNFQKVLILILILKLGCGLGHQGA